MAAKRQGEQKGDPLLDCRGKFRACDLLVTKGAMTYSHSLERMMPATQVRK